MSTDVLETRIVKMTHRLAALEARRLLRERQHAAQARKAEMRRRIELGGAVIAAGCGDWLVPEIIGLLLDGMERVGSSPTIRLGMKQRGEQHLLSKTSSRTRIVNNAAPE